VKEVSDVVLDKVRQQAEAILGAAQEEAARELEESRRRRRQRIEADHKRRLAEADVESARIVAQGTMQARNVIAAAKAAVIDTIVAQARAKLAGMPVERERLRRLLTEAVDGMGKGHQVIVIVAEDSQDVAREVLADDPRLAAITGQVVSRNIGGGVVVESENGALVVDNSYAARLEMLIPRIIVRFGKELF
jgi:V/A-type H+/Na+-transporting ATPase subunit E